METMILFKEHGKWWIQTDDIHTIDLMGTDILQTPFNDLASPEAVLNAIETLNPNATVKLREV